MGRTEIRTALKVDFDKPAAGQPGLHVRILQLLGTQADGLRIDGIQTVGFHFCNFFLISLADLGIKSPLFQPGPVEPHFGKQIVIKASTDTDPTPGPGRYLTFEGFSVDEHGKQHYMDVTVAYRQTTLRCIEYLRRFGYSDYQVYLLLSCAPIQGHVAGIVDVCRIELDFYETESC
jgi:formamidase